MARQKNNIVYYVWLMMSMTVAAVVAEGRFEDADKSNDFLSQSTHHYFDLRHTIPGEPNIDYPIYGEVPRTSFSCSNKHEGYYADIESRCQAFRICTHTAQNTAGFGFLCPNGTLFSQRHFVCDWYRNVRCEESELFYDKNRLNHVGNNYEMMEKVRQMIEHPMKTISKALQQHTYNNNSPRITHTSQQTAKTSYYASSLNSQNVQSEKKSSSGSVTSTDSGQYYSSKIQKTSRPQKVLQNGDIKSFALANEAHKDVYVNSLGELSTDPSAKFDAKTARIIAHPKKATGRNLNFAQSINFGLNDHRSGSSVNQLKNTRGTKDESTLDANFNILRHEIIAELDTKVSGYQPQLTRDDKNFQFLSRGFSTSGDNRTKIKSKNSYQYQPPKQTPNTVRFSNYRNSQHVGHHPQVQTSSSYVPPPTISTKLSTTTIKANPITNKNTAQSTYSPSILIARAEGKRILTNPLSNLPIAQHFQEQHSQQQQQKKTPYVPLNDFLSGRFGAGEITKNVHGSQQQEQKYYPQYQPVQRQEQKNPPNPVLSHQQPQEQHQQQPQPQQQHVQPQQQHQQHLQPQHPQQQQPQIKLPLNPFLSHHNLNHQQQQQQPQQQSYYSQPQQQQPQLQSYYNQPQQQQQQPYSAFTNSNFNNPGNSNQINQLVQNNASQRPNSFLNVKLPTLSDGLIPVPSVPYIPQNAQRRKDTFNLDLETTQGPRPKNIFMGASSYEVPLSSVGRLPNDVQRLRKKI